MAKRDNRWMEEGTYVIFSRPRSLGESGRFIAYSSDYGRIWRYWMYNPDDLPDHDGWILTRRHNGANVIIKRPIPPDRLKRLLARKTA